MKTIQFDKKQSAKIAKAVKLVTAKAIIPAVEDVYLTDGALKFTNLETFVTIKNIDLGANFTLHNKEFTDTVLNLNSFTTELEEGKVVFKSGNKTYKFTGNSMDDMPKARTESNQTAYGILTLNDIDKIQTASQFLSTDDLRPTMCHVCLKGGKVAATNAHKLFWKDTDFSTDIQILLNKTTVKLMSIFSGEEFSISISGEYLIIESESISLEQRILDENYPQYLNVIPESNPISIELDTKEVVENITEALRFSNLNTNMVVFNANGKLTISSSDIDFGKEFSTELENYSKTKGDDITIGFNGKLFIEVLKATTGSKFTITLSEPNRAGVINDCILLMPVMLSNLY